MKDWKKISIPSTISVLEAMKVIDTAASQFVMVIDEKGKLEGVVTDGDIRRGILKNLSLNAPVNQIMNPTPCYLLESVSKFEAIKFLEEKHITHVPLVNHEKIVTGVVSIGDRFVHTKRTNTVVLMVGGLGTRLGELTTNCPKPMLPIDGKPILEIIVRDLMMSGFSDFIFCVNYRADVIKDYFGDGSRFGEIKIRYVQEEKRMGTAGALSLLPAEISGPILVMNGDIVTKVNYSGLIEFHTEHQAKATMAVRNHEVQVPFGVVSVKDGRIQSIKEKPILSSLVCAGIYVIDSSTLSKIPQGEFFDMPEFFSTLIENGLSAQAFPVHEYWLDIGQRDDLVRAETEYAINMKRK